MVAKHQDKAACQEKNRNSNKGNSLWGDTQGEKNLREQICNEVLQTLPNHDSLKG